MRNSQTEPIDLIKKLAFLNQWLERRLAKSPYAFGLRGESATF